mgnify:CR=1 FL=1
MENADGRVFCTSGGDPKASERWHRGHGWKRKFLFSAGSWHSLSPDAGKASAYDQKACREYSLLDLSADGRDGRAVRMVFKERQAIYFVFTAGQPGTFNLYGSQPGDPEVSGCDVMDRGFPAILTSGTLKAGNGFTRTRQMTGLEKKRASGSVWQNPHSVTKRTVCLHPGAFKTYEKGKQGRGRAACRADP